MSRIPMRLALLVAVVFAVPSAVFASPVTINFDSLTEFDAVTNQFPGLTFSNATVLTAGSSLNDLELPPHSGQNVVFDDGGPMSILFDSPVFGLGGYFTYLEPLTLSAYDASNNLIASISSSFLSNVALSGDVGSSPNEFLAFSSLAAISSLTITGDSAGGSFVLDDLTFDTTPSSPPSPTPEPTTLALLGTGLATMLGVRRRHGRQVSTVVDN
jgi:hypothetical protein